MSELFNAIKEQGRHISSLRGGYGTSDAISSLDELVDRVEAENKALCIELDMSLVDSETYKDYILKLEAENEAFKKEIACLKTVPMKYRRMAFNAKLQKENEALRTKLAEQQAMIQEVVSLILDINSPTLDVANLIAKLSEWLFVEKDMTALKAVKAAERERMAQFSILCANSIKEPIAVKALTSLAAAIRAMGDE